MTDEEKAIDYAITEYCHSCTSSCYKNTCKTFCIIRNAVLYGLAEGEKIGKEKQWKATEKAQKKTSAKIKELEKENAELKAQLTILEKRINTLKIKNASLERKNEKMRVEIAEVE